MQKRYGVLREGQNLIDFRLTAGLPYRFGAAQGNNPKGRMSEEADSCAPCQSAPFHTLRGILSHIRTSSSPGLFTFDHFL